MKARGLLLVLSLLGQSACVVPGLEIGPERGGAAGALTGGSASGGSASGGSAGGGSGSGGDSSGAAGASGNPASGSGSAQAGGGTGTGGGAGGGSALEVACEDLPIPPKSQWTVIASTTSLGTMVPTDPLFNPPSNAIDGLMTDRWATGTAQAADGQWFHIDFGTTVAISEVTLEQGTNLQDYPRGYEISLSYRHTDFDADASAQGAGVSVSEIVIPLKKRAVGRYMLIRQTGSAERWWSIAELNVACH